MYDYSIVIVNVYFYAKIHCMAMVRRSNQIPIKFDSFIAGWGNNCWHSINVV